VAKNPFRQVWFDDTTYKLTTHNTKTMKFTEIISIAGYSIEAIGVLVVVIGSVISSIAFIRGYRQLPEGIAYRTYRRQLGRSIILGLEFLIAGDIIRTVIVADTLENVAVLGLIILIRTFLSVTLHLEVEGRWPWQHEEKEVKTE
jgi:uncharacterized membrane protein